jgi:hypothetical protein
MFFYEYETDTYWAWQMYVYADKKFTVSGSGTDDEGWTYNINCSFEKGWNIMYSTDDYDNETWGYSTTKPSGISLNWYFYGGNEAKTYKNKHDIAKKLNKIK